MPGINAVSQFLQGSKLTTIVDLQTAQAWLVTDGTIHFGGSGERVDRWNFFGNPQDFSGYGGSGIPYCGRKDPKLSSDFSTGVNVRCYQQSIVSGHYTDLHVSLAQQWWAKSPARSTVADGGWYWSGDGASV